MKRFLLATVAIAAMTQTVMAADFDAPPPPLPPATSWSGYHIGGSFGGALDLPGLPDGCSNPGAYGAVSDPVAPLDAAAPAAYAYSDVEIANADCQSQVSGDSSSFAAGIRGGYDLQMGSWVTGVLADYYFTDAHQSSMFSFDPDSGVDTSTQVGTLWVNPTDATTGTPLQAMMHETQLDGFGTTRARFGRTFGHDERLLLFVSGGLSYGDVSTTWTETAQYTGEEADRVFDPAASGDGNYDPATEASSLPADCQDDTSTGGVSCSSSGSSSEFQFGYAVGAGMEYMMSDMIAIGGEFMYVNLGDVKGPAGDLDFWTAMATVSLRFK
jgi:outer membrane immunogenic protein